MGLKRLVPKTIRGQVLLIAFFAVGFVIASGRIIDRINNSGYFAVADMDMIGQRAFALATLLDGASEEDRRRILARAQAADIELEIMAVRDVEALAQPYDWQAAVRQLLGFLFPPDAGLPQDARVILYGTQPVLTLPINDSEVLIYKSFPNTVLTTDFTSQLFYYSLATMTLAVLFSIFAVRAITAPLQSLAGQLRSTEAFLAQSEPLKMRGSIEIADLTRALNEMRARIREMMDSRTRMLRSVSHDLRTPLTRVRMRAERIADGEAREPILADVAHINALINVTLDYLRDDRKTEKSERTDIASIMQTICADFSDFGGDITYRGPAKIIWPCKPMALTRAITNLCENGLKFGTRVEVVLAEEAGALRIDIRDDGPGIPPQFHQQVLEPFYKLDKARSRAGNETGFGLGLSIVDEIIRDHGGQLAFGQNADSGLIVTVLLPHRDLRP